MILPGAPPFSSEWRRMSQNTLPLMTTYSAKALIDPLGMPSRFSCCLRRLSFDALLA